MGLKVSLCVGPRHSEQVYFLASGTAYTHNTSAVCQWPSVSLLVTFEAQETDHVLLSSCDNQPLKQFWP